MVQYDFDGRVAFVTGAAQGQGRCHAVKYAENGADVVATDVLEAELERTVELVEEQGGRALGIPMDVADESAVRSAVKESLDEFGRIDSLVNNAGVWGLAEAVEMDESEWERMVDVNLKGTWLCSKHVGTHMIERGEGGKVINVSSGAGHIGWKYSSHYATTKIGVVGLTRSLALEWAEHGINVNAIRPGSAATEMVTDTIEQRIDERGSEAVPDYLDLHGPMNLFDPEGREPIPPEEMSKAVMWLSSDEARYVTGIELPIDAGFLIK